VRKLSSLQPRAPWLNPQILSLHFDRLNSDWSIHRHSGCQVEILSTLFHLPWIALSSLHFLFTNESLHRNAKLLPDYTIDMHFHFLLLRLEPLASHQPAVYWVDIFHTAPHLLLRSHNWSTSCDCKCSRIVLLLLPRLLCHRCHGNLYFKAPQYGEDNKHGKRKAAQRHARGSPNLIKERENNDVLQYTRRKAPHSVLWCD